MKNVKSIALNILRREGGFSDDPDDPGGVTRFGITLKTLIRLGRDFTADGRIDRRDLLKMTRDQALEIYIAEYFYKYKINTLPNIVHPIMFDMSVNSGHRAVKILQQVLAAFGYHVDVDGVIGPQTQKVAKQVVDKAPNHIVDAIAIARRDFYFNLADRNPTLRKYARTRAGGKGGWIKRAEEFLAPKYHLTDIAFKERIKSWD